MSYWETAPDRRLARFVDRVCFSSDDGQPDPDVTRRIVPDGCVDLLFSVADVEPSGGERPCSAEWVGTKTRPLLLRSGGVHENVALRLRPGAAAHLFRVPLHELTDRSLELDALWGSAGTTLRHEIGRAHTPESRARRVQDALLEALRRSDPADAEVAHAVGRLWRSGGAIRVRELCSDLGISERRLERLFRERVGVRPKLLARLLRFRRASEVLRGGAAQVEAALACGYSDQSHLHRDFRRFAGVAPGALSDSSNPGGRTRTRLPA